MPILIRVLPVLLLLICVSSAIAGADEPTYIDDRAVVASIEQTGGELVTQGETTDNATLQEQLASRSVALDPPAEGTLTEEGEDLYGRASQGVVVIAGLYLCGHCDKHHANCASGFIIREDGLVVTNYHVVKNADNTTLVARTHDGRVIPVVEVLAANERDDVAILRLALQDDPLVALPIAREAFVGERVHAITHPDGRFYCYTSGELSRFFLEPRRRGQGVRRMQITADYAKGSSGGPILNDAGQVVGMVTTTTSVYYHEQDGRQENLQMVFHNCVPYESILDLFAGAEEAVADSD